MQITDGGEMKCIEQIIFYKDKVIDLLIRKIGYKTIAEIYDFVNRYDDIK